VALGELGYSRESAPGVKKTFLRFTGLYNTSGFTDYRSGSLALITNTAKKSDNNWWISAAIDKQITQPDKMLPFRGLYQGTTLQYIPPQQNVLTKYFEYRGYYIGKFNSRPFDMFTWSVSYLGFSSDATNTLSGTAAYGVQFSRYRTRVFGCSQSHGKDSAFVFRRTMDSHNAPQSRCAIWTVSRCTGFLES
jgi:hypothetical protein